MKRPRTVRQRAFFQEAPKNWMPDIGETVIVRRMPGNLSVVQSFGTVTGKTLFREYVVVTITRGRQQSILEWLLTDLRPYRPRALLRM